MVDAESKQPLDQIERLAIVRSILTTGYTVDDQVGRELVNLLLVLAHYPYEPDSNSPLPPPLPKSLEAPISPAKALWDKVRAMRRR